jgi:hypothetical protein
MERIVARGDRDKRPPLSVKNKTDLMPNNASCKRWDTPLF